MTNFKAYYAHSMLIYGTAREKEEIRFLTRAFPGFEIINPSALQRGKSMTKFLKIVSKSKRVIASEFLNYVGRGVFSEVARALSDGIEVKVLRKKGGKYTLEPITGIQVINAHDWKRKYAKIITE